MTAVSLPVHHARSFVDLIAPSHRRARLLDESIFSM